MIQISSIQYNGEGYPKVLIETLDNLDEAITRAIRHSKNHNYGLIVLDIDEQWHSTYAFGIPTSKNSNFIEKIQLVGMNLNHAIEHCTKAGVPLWIEHYDGKVVTDYEKCIKMRHIRVKVNDGIITKVVSGSKYLGD